MYKEIFIGAVFGLGACVIDVVMHVSMSKHTFYEEVVDPSPSMLLYRSLFMVLGVGVGVLLWQRNRRERDYRELANRLDRLRRDMAGPMLVIHTNLQLMLTKYGSDLSTPVSDVVKSTYETSCLISRILNKTE